MRIRRLAIIFAVFATLVSFGAIVFWWEGKPLPLAVPQSPTCVVTGGEGSPDVAGPSASPAVPVTLDPDQLANAATIGAVGIRRGLPQQAIVVALATAWQESKLVNLAGGDRDSIGLFQQRPSQGWGTPEQLADPRYSANAFYTSLLKVHGWQAMRVTDAAQAVQRSAHPQAYQKWSVKAAVLARAFSGEAPEAVACTLVGDPVSRGPVAASTLAASLTGDWGSKRIQAALETDLAGLALTVGDPQAGWQYAHWLVAHAQERSIKTVEFAGLQWSASSGTWTTVTKGNESNSASQVRAEVFGV